MAPKRRPPFPLSTCARRATKVAGAMPRQCPLSRKDQLRSIGVFRRNAAPKVSSNLSHAHSKRALRFTTSFAFPLSAYPCGSSGASMNRSLSGAVWRRLSGEKMAIDQPAANPAAPTLSAPINSLGRRRLAAPRHRGMDRRAVHAQAGNKRLCCASRIGIPRRPLAPHRG